MTDLQVYPNNSDLLYMSMWSFTGLHHSHGPEFSAIMLNTTGKAESPLENEIHLRKIEFTEKVIFRQNHR